MIPRIALMIIGYWNVPERNIPAFLKYYQDVIHECQLRCHDFVGSTLTQRTRPSAADLEGPLKVISPHGGMYTAGVRTNVEINFDALLQHEYNFIDIGTYSEGSSPEEHKQEFLAAFDIVQPNW